MPQPPTPPADDEMLDTKIEAEVEHEIEMEGDYEQPPGPLKYHYGDGTIIDAGTMIHDECGGVISIIDDGLVCECGANSDLPLATDEHPALSFESVKEMTDDRAPSEKTLQPFRDALARDKAESEQRIHEQERLAVESGWIEPAPEPSMLAPTCIERHVPSCECRGAARGPRP